MQYKILLEEGSRGEGCQANHGRAKDLVGVRLIGSLDRRPSFKRLDVCP
jgi:hypothetical protein